MAGVVVADCMNESIAFEIASTAPATPAGNARQAGIMPMRTSVLPGPGVSGVPWAVLSETLAAGGIT